MGRWFTRFVRGLSKIILVVVVVAAGLVPLLFARKLEEHALSASVVTAILLGAAFLLQLRNEAAEKNELQRVSNRLKVQEGRSATLKWMINLLMVPIVMIEGDISKWGEQEKKEASEKLDRAMSALLEGMSKEIAAYWGQKDAKQVNANLMIVHATAACSSAELERLGKAALFLVYERPLNTYPYVLELLLWGKPEADVPASLVLPVENPKDATGKRKLVPGAPTAFALGKDQFVRDTHKIVERMADHPDGAGADLDQDVRVKIETYFKGHSFRSFVSLVLQNIRESRPIGVVNIQSNEVDRFRQDDRDVETLIKSLEHYRFCLEYLLTGRYKIMGTKG